MDDSTTPATKADIERLELSIRLLIERSDAEAKRSEQRSERLAAGLGELVATVDRRTRKIHDDIDIVIELIGNIDRRRDEKRQDLERRVVRLEQQVGLAK